MQTGLGIRPEIINQVEQQLPQLGFLEAHSENYFGHSINRSKLLDLRQHYPISLHGVGLSLGRADNLDLHHLANLRGLVAELEPCLVSEHLAWSAYSHRHIPDLLPLPLTTKSLSLMCAHISQMQDVLQRQILLENPSNYLLFDQLQIPEPEFLNEVAERSGCQLLLDINNVYVSATNLQRDAYQYVDSIDAKHIGQFHLAGHTEVTRQGESVLIDTQNQLVRNEVWDLFQHAIDQHGDRPTLIEWDSDFPQLDVLLDECARAQSYLGNGLASGAALAFDDVEYANRRVFIAGESSPIARLDGFLADQQNEFLDHLLNSENGLPLAAPQHRQRMWIYRNNVLAATHDYLAEVYPAVAGVVGKQYFMQLAHASVRLSPPQQGDIHCYGERFGDVLIEFSVLSELPYLADLVRYEWALHAAYFAVPGDIIDPQEVEQQALLLLPVRFNDSVSLLTSAYPIYQVHRQSLPDFSGEVSINLAQGGGTLLVYKIGFKVHARELEPEEASNLSLFFAVLADSENLMQAIASVSGSLSPQAISATLALMFQLRLLCSADN